MTNDKKDNLVPNYGLNLVKEARDRQPDEDWVFGAASVPCLAQIPPEERERYLPEGEVQRGREDMMDCVARAFINTLETKFNWLYVQGILSEKDGEWLRENGYVTEKGIAFSDAFIAILSGTTRSGNSLKAPAHAIHEHGLVPKHLLPLEKHMTWEEYHDPARITNRLRMLGKEFLARFSLNYEIVYENYFEKQLNNDILNVGAFAWPEPVDGIYPAVDIPPNHAFIVYEKEWFAFDNYIDSVDGDYIKHLAEDYIFLGYGYRIYIGKGSSVKKNWLRELLKKIFNY